MEEREHEREKELERKRRADHPGGSNRDNHLGKKDRRESLLLRCRRVSHSCIFYNNFECTCCLKALVSIHGKICHLASVEVCMLLYIYFYI